MTGESNWIRHHDPIEKTARTIGRIGRPQLLRRVRTHPQCLAEQPHGRRLATPTAVQVTEQDLREEIAIVQEQGSTALDMVAEFGPGLNEKGKEMVITAAYQIANADGRIDPTEQQLLEELADRMEITKAHLRGIMAELEEAAR